MIIYITMKSLSKRKDYLTKKEIQLGEIPKTLRDLLSTLVTTHVSEFNPKTADADLVNFLISVEIEQQVPTGKVGFGVKYNDQKADSPTAVRTTIQAYEDGLYRVFINEQESLDLDGLLELKEGDQLTFIKLTMLAGRMW